MFFRKKEYIYFVSYWQDSNNIQSVSNCEIIIDHLVKSIADIRSIEQKMIDTLGFDNLVVSNYIRLK